MHGLIRRAVVVPGALVVAGAGLGVIAAAPAASAATAHPLAARFAPAANATRTSKAGYELTHAPASASASDNFTVPTLTCPPTGTSAINLGAFIHTSSALTGGYVTAECSSGTAVYTGVMAWNGTTGHVGWTPAAGDLIKVSASQTATAATVDFVDITKGLTAGGTIPGAATNSSVLVGMTSVLSSSNTKLPVPPFGTERFNEGTIDGRTVKASGAVAEDMQTSTHVLQIHTDALSSTGKAWSEVFRHS
jgi:hypothetical protein